MKKYMANFWECKITAIEVEKESDHYVWVNGARCSKKTQYEEIVNTWDNAYQALMIYAHEQLKQAQNRLNYAIGKIEKIKGLKWKESLCSNQKHMVHIRKCTHFKEISKTREG